MQRPNHLQPIITSAKECIALGNIIRAKSLLLGASRNLPQNSEINRLLGITEAISGNFVMALEFFNKSIKLDPKNSHAHSNRGNIHKALGDSNKAINDYSAAIKIDPRNSEAFYNRALMHEALHQIEYAIEDYSKAISINPDYIDAYLNIAVVLIGERRLLDALDCLRSLAGRNPHIPNVWLNMGYIFNVLKEYKLALESHDKALELNPNDARVWSNKGMTLDAMGLSMEALACYETAIQLNPKDAAAYTNQGYTLHKQKKYTEALLCYDTALNIDRDFADAWCNMGMTFMELKRYEEAKQAFMDAFKSDPQHGSSHLNLGHLLLGLFEFEAGWDEYEWRWKSNQNDSIYFASSKPLWQGQDKIDNLFVWSEQGIGDQILYSTLLPELSQYARSITVSTDKKLIPVLRQSYDNITFIDNKTLIQDEGFDYQVPIASLPKFLRPNLNSFLAKQRSHLRLGHTLAQTINGLVAAKVASSKKKCGLSWFSGNQKLGGDKSIPIIDLAPILSLEKYEFIDLQYGDTREGRGDVLNQIGVEVHKFYEINNDDDLEGLLALINACDVVVTVSNTTAHLAAGLGKKVLLLLPYSAGKFWYWNSYQGNNLWYDNVVTFEQEIQGEWVAPILKVKSYLQNSG